MTEPLKLPAIKRRAALALGAAAAALCAAGPGDRKSTRLNSSHQ